MRKLEGKTGGVLTYKNIEWVCDILEYEIPLLSFYKLGRKLLFCLWVEREKSNDRYLLFDVSAANLASYFSADLSLLEIIENSTRIIAFESNGKGRKNLRFVKFEKLFDDYRPAEDSYFDPAYATDDAVELAKEKQGDYYINIDGEWYLEDWSDVTHVYKQVYAFNHSIRNIDAPHVAKVQSGINSLPFRGGTALLM
ncbi:hypothetical protein SAMN05443245_0467 [Paraburkholderia fungorum]|uniref:Uncharacterized protein n=1 Tax=Paraburkholderia fungorum TaxID=134537 RepID=A0A1H0Z5R6_9BURK|nr:hypothetical protein [Paraburkholderia fungorum]SDQ22775.1 hypothetical protein SAMN05443245_0467 [Paraburkholderia fungorum]